MLDMQRFGFRTGFLADAVLHTNMKKEPLAIRAK